jgi:plastocyanin
VRRAFVLVVFASCALGALSRAGAETHHASIGNYWYEDDVQRDRTKIVVQEGDQITFTVREGVYPPHTVDVDELNIHSPGLLPGETFTTPALTKVGNFKLYCRPHEDRGHHTRLIVQSKPRPSPVSTPSGTLAPRPGAAPVTTTAAPSPSASATPTLAPVGVGKATGAVRPVAVDPDSLEGLTGRTRPDEPWTRAVWFLVIGAVPILGAAGYAVRRELVRATAGSGPSPRDRARSTARSPRSSARKASGSGRTSRDRRR